MMRYDLNKKEREGFCQEVSHTCGFEETLTNKPEDGQNTARGALMNPVLSTHAR